MAKKKGILNNMDLDFNKEGQVFELVGINPENGKPDPEVHIPFHLATKYELVSYFYKNLSVSADGKDDYSLDEIVAWFNAQGVYFKPHN